MKQMLTMFKASISATRKGSISQGSVQVSLNDFIAVVKANADIRSVSLFQANSTSQSVLLENIKTFTREDGLLEANP